MLGLSHSAVAGVSCKSSCRHGGRAGGAATDFLCALSGAAAAAMRAVAHGKGFSAAIVGGARAGASQLGQSLLFPAAGCSS